jgi:sugar-specific transcriptional regulator TrmB
MRKEILEEIGLTKSEINVYLALLELGSTTTGKIVDKAEVASSKIYEILDKLIQKGLASFIIKSGVKYFEAAPPERIMDYMKEKERKFNSQKDELKKLLPELELKQKLAKHKSEATVFRGLKGAETAMNQILKTMKKGEEYYLIGGVAGAWKPFMRFIKHYHEKRSKLGIKVKILYSEAGHEWAEDIKNLPNTEIKFAPSQLLTSNFILMYKDITILAVPTKTDVTYFKIENKEVTDSFKSQFELLWNQKVQTFEGQEAVESAFNLITKSAKKNDVVNVFAAKPETQRGADFNVQWNREIRKKVKNVKLMYYGDNKKNRERAKEIEKQGCETKIIPTQETLPISTIVVGDKVFNTVWGKKPILFEIENKTLADSLRGNFDLLWNQDTRIVKGVDAIQNIFEDMLEAGNVDFIAARGYFVDKRPKYIDDWEKRAIKQGFKMRNLVDPETKGHRITKFPFVRTKYTLPKEFAKLSVIWIYGNKVVISNWTEKEPIAVIIENKSLHDMYKTQFELLWNKDIIKSSN